MARLRFPGRPGQRFSQFGVKYGAESNQIVTGKQRQLTKYTAQDLEYFHEQFGGSEEENEEFVGFTAGELYKSKVEVRKCEAQVESLSPQRSSRQHTAQTGSYRQMLQRGLRILPRRTSVATTTQHKLQGSDASRRVSSVEATPASTETTPTLINTSRSLTGVTADLLPASTPRRRRHLATKPRLDSEVPATTTAPPSGKASSRSAARKKRATTRANNQRTSEPDAVSAMMADAVAPASEGKPEVVTAATKGSEVEGVTAATKGSEVEGVTAATKGSEVEGVTAATKGSEVEGVTAATKGSEVEGVTAATKGSEVEVEDTVGGGGSGSGGGTAESGDLEVASSFCVKHGGEEGRKYVQKIRTVTRTADKLIIRNTYRYKHGNLVHKTSIKTVHAKTSGEATKPPKRGGRQPKQTVAPPAGEDRLSPTVRVEDVPASPPSAVTLADGTTIKTESDSSVGIPYAIPAVHLPRPPGLFEQPLIVAGKRQRRMTTVAEEYLLDEEMRKRGARSIPREEQQADQKATLQKCLQIVKRAKKKLSGKTEVAMTTATERRSKDRLPTSLVEWAKKGFAKIRPKVNSAAQNLLPPPSLIRRTYPEADPYHPRCMVCDTYALHTISLHYDKLVCNSCRKFYRTLFTDIGFERCRTMGELSCDCGVRTCRVCRMRKCVEVFGDVSPYRQRRHSNKFTRPSKVKQEEQQEEGLLSSQTAGTEEEASAGKKRKRKSQKDLSSGEAAKEEGAMPKPKRRRRLKKKPLHLGEGLIKEEGKEEEAAAAAEGQAPKPKRKRRWFRKPVFFVEEEKKARGKNNAISTDNAAETPPDGATNVKQEVDDAAEVDAATRRRPQMRAMLLVKDSSLLNMKLADALKRRAIQAQKGVAQKGVGKQRRRKPLLLPPKKQKLQVAPPASGEDAVRSSTRIQARIVRHFEKMRSNAGEEAEDEDAEEGRSPTKAECQGPRIKHVARRMEVALGKPAMAEATTLHLSALPDDEKTNLRSSDDSDDEWSVAGKPKKKAGSVGSATPRSTRFRRIRCGRCLPCCRKDCRTCPPCIDMSKYGGRGVYKKGCKLRICEKPQFGRDIKDGVAKGMPISAAVKKVRGKAYKHNKLQMEPQVALSKLPNLSRLHPHEVRAFVEKEMASPVKLPPQRVTRKLVLARRAGRPSKKMLALRKLKAQQLTRVEGKPLHAYKPAELAGDWEDEDLEAPRLLKVDFVDDYDEDAIWANGASVISVGAQQLNEVCYLCGCDGEEEFVYCTVCSEPFHDFCIDEDERPTAATWQTWICPKCLYCEVCGQQENLLQCHKCKNMYHAACLGKHYPRKPSKHQNIWVCVHCVKCKSCGATKPGTDSRAQWVLDFSMCQACAALMYKGNYCPVCKQCYEDDDYDCEMVECSVCLRWLHATCEDMTSEMYHCLSHLPEDVLYNCNACTLQRPAAWQTALDAYLQNGLVSVITHLMNMKSAQHLLQVNRADSPAPPVGATVQHNVRLASTTATPDGAAGDGNTQMMRRSNRHASHQGAVATAQGDNRSAAPSRSLVAGDALAVPVRDASTAGRHRSPSPVSGEVRCLLSSLVERVAGRHDDEAVAAAGAPLSAVNVAAHNRRLKEEAEKEPRDLSSVHRKVMQRDYTAVDVFSNDVMRIIVTSSASADLRKPCSTVKATFHKIMLKTFPWYNVKASRYWTDSKKDSRVMVAPPPYGDHSYVAAVDDARGADDRLSEETRTADSPTMDDNPSLLDHALSNPAEHSSHAVMSPTAVWECTAVRGHTELPAQQTPAADAPPLPTTPDEVGSADKGKLRSPALHRGDTRKCSFCLRMSDSKANNEGRLLYAGHNEWVHINCALWSSEVFEDEDGTLQNVESALSRGKFCKCSLCGNPGATVGCCAKACPATFHFMCARAANAAFQEDKKVFCERDKDWLDGKLIIDNDFTMRRLVRAQLDPSKWNKYWQRGVEPRTTTLMSGALTIENLGEIGHASDREEALYPIDYRCKRLYWSTVDPTRRCVYTTHIKLNQRDQPEEEPEHLTIVHDENHPDYRPLSSSELERLYGKLVETCKHSTSGGSDENSSLDDEPEEDDGRRDDGCRDDETELAQLTFGVPSRPESSDALVFERPRVGCSPTAELEEEAPSSVVSRGEMSPKALPNGAAAPMLPPVAGVDEQTNVTGRCNGTSDAEEDGRGQHPSSGLGKKQLLLPPGGALVKTLVFDGSRLRADTEQVAPSVPMPADVAGVPRGTRMRLACVDKRTAMQLPGTALQYVMTVVVNERSIPVYSKPRDPPTTPAVAPPPPSALAGDTAGAPPVRLGRERSVRFAQEESSAAEVAPPSGAAAVTGRGPHRQRKQNLQCVTTAGVEDEAAAAAAGRGVLSPTAGALVTSHTPGFNPPSGDARVSSDEVEKLLVTEGTTTPRRHDDDDEPRLVFEVVAADDGFRAEAATIEDAWQRVIESVQRARADAGLTRISFAGVSGLSMLGVADDSVRYLLEQMPGAEKCLHYRFRYHQYHASLQHGFQPQNDSGCARAEAYRGRSKHDMFSWLASRHRKRPRFDASAVVEENELQPKSSRRATSMGLPMAMRFRHLRASARDAVGVYRSRIHGRGLFCKRDIDAGEMVVEYAGQVVRSSLTDKREKYYEGKGIGCYMFRIDQHLVVDATLMGNAARFINHSCEPNCYSKIIVTNDLKHIVIFATHAIQRGAELTYDYKFPYEEEKIPCTCSSKKCRKYLN